MSDSELGKRAARLRWCGIAFWVLAQLGVAWPGEMVMALFWPTAIFSHIGFAIANRREGKPLWWTELLGLPGALCNAIAMGCNGGRMPAINVKHPSGIWIPMSESAHVRWMTDIHRGWSIGDMLLGIGLLLMMLAFAVHVGSKAKEEGISHA